MSYQAWAKVVAGVVLKREDLHEKKQVPNCQHKPNTSYCPICGKPKGTHAESTPLLEDPDAYFRPFELVYVGPDDDRFVVGKVISSAGYDEEKLKGLLVDQQEIAKVKEVLKAKLQPLGLWDEKQFGLSLVFEQSY